MNRRNLLKGIIGLTGAGFLSGMYAWQIEPFWLEFVKLKMPIKNLPPELVGKTLMQISDIHIGKRFNHQYIIDSFKKAQELNPDFVAYTGDYISLHNNAVQYKELAEVLNHSVKGKLGTVGILGNHDYGVDWSEPAIANSIVETLYKHGITVLRNEQKAFEQLNFIGIDDYWGTNFNPTAVMNNYNSNLANVVLCHNPDVCDLNVWNGYGGWILAGHTHGGQCKPPFLNAPILPVKNKKYSSGKIDLSQNRTLYINRALGFLWQVRFNVRPEITLFELSAA